MLFLSLTCLVLNFDPPKPGKPAPAITVNTASQIRLAETIPGRIDRILRGPGRGELLLSDWKTGAFIADERSLKKLRPFAEGKKNLYLSVSPDGQWLAWHSGSEQTCTIVNALSGKSFTIEFEHSVGLAGFSPDGQRVAIGSTYWDPRAEGVGYSELMIFDMTGKRLQTYEKTKPGAVKPVFSPDGKILAVGNRNAETRLYDAVTGKRLHILDKVMTQEIAFSPDGQWLAAGYVDGTVAIWEVATGKMLHSAKEGHEIYSVDWNPTGDVLATAGLRGRPVLWNPAGLTRLKELDAADWAGQIRFTANGTRLLVGSAMQGKGKDPYVDWKVTVWSVPEGR